MPASPSVPSTALWTRDSTTPLLQLSLFSFPIPSDMLLGLLGVWVSQGCRAGRGLAETLSRWGELEDGLRELGGGDSVSHLLGGSPLL